MKEIGISEEVLDMMRDIFKGYAEVQKIILFGSRSKGNYKDYSDIDVAIVGTGTLLLYENLLLDLEALPILYSFDVVSYEHLDNDQLKKHIDRVGIAIYERVYAD